MSNTNLPLTTPDLIILGLLSEKPQHGYEINAELARRDVEDWAGVSRPQVYYSLKKLGRNSYIEPVETISNNQGPERFVYKITESGAYALREALAEKEWARQRTLPAFVTWLALSPHATYETKIGMISERETFLREQIEREREHLQEVQQEPGVMGSVGSLMIRFTITGFQQELIWLVEVRETIASAVE